MFTLSPVFPDLSGIQRARPQGVGAGKAGMKFWGEGGNGAMRPFGPK